MLQHRIWSIPLVNPPQIEDHETCRYCGDYNDDGCERCQMVFTLRYENTHPKDDVYVFSHQLMALRTGTDVVKCAPDMPIVKLGPGQKIHVMAIARMGCSSKHARWNVCTIASYRYEAHIEINPKVASTWTDDQKTTIAKSCPKACFNLKTMEIEDHAACIYCYRCKETANRFLPPTTQTTPVEQGIIIHRRPQRFIFTIATNGTYRSRQALTMALDIWKKRHELSES
jgi:DNA-directed RNA polymerase alpha subunit